MRGWQHGVSIVGVVLLLLSCLLPAIDVPGRTLSGVELVGLSLASGVERLLDGPSSGARALGSVMLLAVAGNLVVPFACLAWRRVPRGVGLALCTLVLAASVYLTWRAVAQPAVHLRVGAGLWYAAMVLLLSSRAWAKKNADKDHRSDGFAGDPGD